MGSVGGLKVFYINRDKDTDRRADMEAQLTAANLEAERIVAIEGRNLPKELEHTFPPSRLSPGEVGCYASHMLAWMRIVEDDLPYALVLEDDAVVDSAAAAEIADVLSAVPAGWDFIHVSMARCRAYRPLATLPSGRTLVKFSRIPAGAVGYLLSNAGARKLLKPVPRLFPVDLDTRRPWIFGHNVYGVIAPPIRHNGQFTSTISPEPKLGRSRARRGIQLDNPLYAPKALIYTAVNLGFVWWVRCSAANLLHRGGWSAASTPDHAERQPIPAPVE